MEKLVIAEQSCLLEEKFSKNGVQKNVHVVVKNTPFTITLVLDKQTINFNQFSADVQLVYDCPTLKEVDFVKLKPMEYKLKPSEDGDQLTVELRIKVLTSQLEDMFFRVRIALVDPHSLQEVSSHFVVLSHPIRVVSKPDQVKKKIKKRKRAPTDNLMDTLTRIEAQQKEQQRLLKRLCNPSAPSPSNLSGSTGVSSEGSTSTSSSPDAPDSFHKAFTDFLAAFTHSSGGDDAYKVNTSAQDAQTMCEILDLVRMELKRTGHYAQPSSPCVDSPPLPANTIAPPSMIPPAPPLPLLSLSSCPSSPVSPSTTPSHPHPSSSPNGYNYRGEKMDANSLEGELFSNCGLAQHYNFGAFQDLSTMFASQ